LISCSGVSSGSMRLVDRRRVPRVKDRLRFSLTRGQGPNRPPHLKLASGQEKRLPPTRRVPIHLMIFMFPDWYRLCSTVSTDATFSAERGSAQASGPTHQHAERSARV
jgi:hypothetical protein